MFSESYILKTRSPEETEEAGLNFARSSSPGDIVSLLGDLGAGKTTFVRGFVKGLGGSPQDVASPSFTIYTVYTTPSGEVYHVDLYRLDAVDEDIVREIFEAADEGARVLVEWADRWDVIVKNSCYVIKFTAEGEKERTIEIIRRG